MPDRLRSPVHFDIVGPSGPAVAGERVHLRSQEPPEVTWPEPELVLGADELFSPEPEPEEPELDELEPADFEPAEDEPLPVEELPVEELPEADELCVADCCDADAAAPGSV